MRVLRKPSQAWVCNFTHIAEPAMCVSHLCTVMLWLTKYITLIFLSRVTQTKLYDLDSQVRRGAAERGAVERKKNEFEDEIQRQKEQMEHMESLYKRQLEGAQNMCTQEKVQKTSECLKLLLLQAWKMWMLRFYFFLLGHPAEEYFHRYQNHTATKR